MNRQLFIIAALIFTTASLQAQTWTDDGNGNIYNANSGVVGIGTATPDSAYELSVNGKIRAKEIKVEASWSDFVFEEGYYLRSLEEVEQFISNHKHLPDIPSESEIQKTGVAIGEMHARLLQKIEELTLYVLALDKEGKALQQRLHGLRPTTNEGQ